MAFLFTSPSKFATFLTFACLKSEIDNRDRLGETGAVEGVVFDGTVGLVRAVVDEGEAGA